MLQILHSSQFKGVYLLESFIDYFKILKQISVAEKNKILWYRGQLCGYWHLTPNLFRNAKTVGDFWGRPIDPMNSGLCQGTGGAKAFPDFKSELEEFKRLVIKKFYDHIYLPSNDFDWLFLGQHYGLLTPLVDFTTDPLVALFFSTEGKFARDRKYQDLCHCCEQFSGGGYSDDCAAIFVLLPEEINSRLPFGKEGNANIKKLRMPIVINEEDEALYKSYLTRKNVPFNPICIIAPKTDYRLIRQSGNFLWYGDNVQSIDYIINFREALYKIYIPYSLFSDFKKMLKILNLTKQTIYGNIGYTKIAKKCKQNIEKDFYKEIEKISLVFKNKTENN